ncbi:unnamed protein product [Adineta steineri]|uniref:EGF-like domain-containing protein n=1 Tax=Adineta steineri TaxID=433720 RepID=A0A819GV68_9BILA|nr:unnamed protein product [Adineta steineri]CAF3888543.1 unnamed protein product [Adineta steineri]
MVAFLRKPSITINYLKWYNDSCTIDVITTSPIIECDRSLRLYCSKITEKCECLNNMYWNGSFCDCSVGMFYSGNNYCQERYVFGQICNPQIDSCMEYLICSTSTNSCDCSSNSYYNQTTCNPKLPFNATQSCTLSSQCITGLVCSSNVCTCPSSQSWNGDGCSNSSAYGEYCLTSTQCDSSALLICNSTYSRCACNINSYWNGKICVARLNNGSLCNNTQQCYSNLICINNYCQCPLINTQYWSSQTLTCQLCYGKNLFLFSGICYNIPPPTNSTLSTYSTLSLTYTLSTIQYDYQLNYLFNQHARVYNWIPIYFASNNPIGNYFHWTPDNTLIKSIYFCNETIQSNYIGYVLSFKLEAYTSCLRAWSSTTIGQLAYQLNNYNYHTR